MSLGLQIKFLAVLLVATVLLCVGMMQQHFWMSSAKNSSKGIAHCARKTYVKVVLEMFLICA
jgi:Na+/pantothenate symporter